MITLLDGAIGQELVTRAPEEPTSLWSTQTMMDHPEILQDVHREYFEAGAIIATANTYAIHRDRLQRFDIEDKFEELQIQALTIANQARDAHGSGYVAGAIGPLVATYRPDLAPPAEEAADAFAEIAQLQAGLVDCFLLETMASIDQALGAVMGASVAGKPIWLSVTVNDHDGSKLRSGEPLDDLVKAMSDQPIAALLVNCAFPEAITQSMPHLPDTLPTGGYGNGFTEISEAFAKPGQVVTDLQARKDLGPDEYAEHAIEWARLGGTIIGGCCEIGPAHIKVLKACIEQEGFELAKEVRL